MPTSVNEIAKNESRLAACCEELATITKGMVVRNTI
jgi:hypothetical protein